MVWLTPWAARIVLFAKRPLRCWFVQEQQPLWLSLGSYRIEQSSEVEDVGAPGFVGQGYSYGYSILFKRTPTWTLGFSSAVQLYRECQGDRGSFRNGSSIISKRSNLSIDAG